MDSLDRMDKLEPEDCQDYLVLLVHLVQLVLLGQGGLQDPKDLLASQDKLGNQEDLDLEEL